MKYSKKETHRKTFSFPKINFETQKLTSFSGLILFQDFFAIIRLKERLKKCFHHLKLHPIFGFSTIILWLIIHLILGYRKIRDLKYYENDPMVKRLIGLSRMPDISTISRSLSNIDAKGVEKYRSLSSDLVLEELSAHDISRVTADFDGSVIFSKRHAENSAAGYNKQKKGALSYYPLLCSIAQTGQIFDVLHRPGNVHDSKHSLAFVESCISKIWDEMPLIPIDTRMDGAFFNRSMADMLDDMMAEFTISVPFYRLAELIQVVENRERWRRIDYDIGYFEMYWKPKSWKRKYRFIFVRTLKKIKRKEVIQLDMLEPYDYEYEYKAIITNKTTSAKNVIAFHNGRGSQEGIFGELKSQTNMEYIPFKRLLPNQIFLISAIMAHNLVRSLQMMANSQSRSTTFKRTALWVFQQIDTFRKNIIIRAGRFTRPKGTLTLTISGNEKVKEELSKYLDKMKKAA